MRRPSLVVYVSFVAILCVCGVGCNSNNKGKIEGTKWTSQAATIKGQLIPAGFLQLEFSREGRLWYVAGPKQMTGTYSLGWGDNVTLHLDQELAGHKNHVERVRIAGNTLTMTDSDGTQVTFNRDK